MDTKPLYSAKLLKMGPTARKLTSRDGQRHIWIQSQIGNLAEMAS